MPKYKVQVRVKMCALPVVEVTADSESEAREKAEEELLDWDIDDFNYIEIHEAEAELIQLIEV